MASPRTQTELPEPAQTPDVLTDDQAGTPTHDEISRLAHSYWLGRKPEEGSAEDDWFRAERELRGTTVKEGS